MRSHSKLQGFFDFTERIVRCTGGSTMRFSTDSKLLYIVMDTVHGRRSVVLSGPRYGTVSEHRPITSSLQMYQS